MSTSPEQETINAGTHNITASQTQTKSGSGMTGEGREKPADKTISCVSCRRRKLKCDRIKPQCSTCGRLRHDCEYPERRRNLGAKRRNMKELEARLAQVETQLVAETKQTTANTEPVDANVSSNWDATMNMNMNMNLDMDVDFNAEGLQNLDFDILQGIGSGSGSGSGNTVPMGDFFSQDVISLGLQEPLPPDSLMDDLYRIYFEKIHVTLPLIHKRRFYAALDMPPNHRPMVSLRYAMMCMAASASTDYLQYAEVFYERARRYAELTEMKGKGEAFVNIQSVQTWILTANYEANNAYFSRAWMSTGRSGRLCHMLCLHTVDSDGGFTGKRILPVAKDWIELEERRRTFWAAFYGDRWSSSATGWPMVFDERKIETNMPSSEESFDMGIEQQTTSLAKALTPDGAAKISTFGGVILSACLTGHNTEHMAQKGPNERQDDLANGEFWKRHRKMDNLLSSTFMFLPDRLRLPSGLRDPNIVFFHMNIHTATICLHQGAVLTAQRNNIQDSVIQQSEARILMAAEEVANIMRLISHLDASRISSWLGFCLYVSAGVFLQNLRKGPSNPTSASNLEFLLSAMRAVGKHQSVTQHFTAHIELELENSDSHAAATIYQLTKADAPSVKVNGTYPCDIGPRTATDEKVTEATEQSKTTIPISLGGVMAPSNSKSLSGLDIVGSTFPMHAAFSHYPQDSGSETIDSEFSHPGGQMGNTPSSESSTSNTNTNSNTYAYRTPKSQNATLPEGVSSATATSAGTAASMGTNEGFQIDANGNWSFEGELGGFGAGDFGGNGNVIVNGDAGGAEGVNGAEASQGDELLDSLLNNSSWDARFGCYAMVGGGGAGGGGGQGGDGSGRGQR